MRKPTHCHSACIHKVACLFICVTEGAFTQSLLLLLLLSLFCFFSNIRPKTYTNPFADCSHGCLCKMSNQTLLQSVGKTSNDIMTLPQNWYWFMFALLYMRFINSICYNEESGMCYIVLNADQMCHHTAFGKNVVLWLQKNEILDIIQYLLYFKSWK